MSEQRFSGCLVQDESRMRKHSYRLSLKDTAVKPKTDTILISN